MPLDTSIQHEPPFTFEQLTASVRRPDVAMTDEYRIVTTFIFNCLGFFFQTDTFFPPCSQASGPWTRQRVFF